MKKLITNQKGFTLFEIAVVLILSTILLATTASLYSQVAKTNRRLQRINFLERSLLNTQLSLKQSLTTLPGRGLGSFGDAFATATLPAAGTLSTDKGVQPIRLGIITPYKINGFDAFTIAYTDAKIPRLEIGELTTANGNIGSAKVMTPFNSRTIGLPHSGQNPPIQPISNQSNPNDSYNVISKTTPTPTPSPSSTPTPHIPVPPPTIGNTGTVTGIPYYADKSMFQPGNLVLLISSPFGTGIVNNQQTFITPSRIVKIISVTGPQGVTVAPFNQQAIQLTYDLCLVGECDPSLPLTNLGKSPKILDVGAIIAPIKVASFYVKQNQAGNFLVRNDGGLIMPDGNGSFQVRGGKETNIGEVDSISVNYLLEDGTTQPTPNNPLVPWLDQITSVDIMLSKGAPPVQGSESFNRNLKLSFPITIRNIE